MIWSAVPQGAFAFQPPQLIVGGDTELCYTSMLRLQIPFQKMTLHAVVVCSFTHPIVPAASTLLLLKSQAFELFFG